jgi:hypothetical protein
VTREYREAQALSVDEMERLIEAVDFGAHARFHPVLTTCLDAECETEIESSRTEVETVIGGACVDFSYPNGDYGDRELRACSSGRIPFSTNHRYRLEH